MQLTNKPTNKRPEVRTARVASGVMARGFDLAWLVHPVLNTCDGGND